MTEEFQPPWWLTNSHGQTIYGAAFRSTPLPPLEKRELTTPDKDFLTTFWLHGDKENPTVLLINGLEGSVQSHYARGFLSRLAVNRWNAVVMEHRGCNGPMNLAPRLYHSGEITDLAWMVETLSKNLDGGKLFIIGFSLGSNLVGNWLGKFGDNANVTGAAMISTPFDLTPCGPAIDTVLGGFYARRFLKTLIPKAIAKAKQFPNSFSAAGVEKIKSIVEYDNRITAPWHGFDDAWDYYKKCGCHQVIDKISKPTLVISSKDDPLVPGNSIPFEALEKNPFTKSIITEKGGHLGFIHGSPWMLKFWWEDKVWDWMQTVK